MSKDLEIKFKETGGSEVKKSMKNISTEATETEKNLKKVNEQLASIEKTIKNFDVVTEQFTQSNQKVDKLNDTVEKLLRSLDKVKCNCDFKNFDDATNEVSLLDKGVSSLTGSLGGTAKETTNLSDTMYQLDSTVKTVHTDIQKVSTTLSMLQGSMSLSFRLLMMMVEVGILVARNFKDIREVFNKLYNPETLKYLDRLLGFLQLIATVKGFGNLAKGINQVQKVLQNIANLHFPNMPIINEIITSISMFQKYFALYNKAMNTLETTQTALLNTAKAAIVAGIGIGSLYIYNLARSPEFIANLRLIKVFKP